MKKFNDDLLDSIGVGIEQRIPNMDDFYGKICFNFANGMFVNCHVEYTTRQQARKNKDAQKRKGGG